LVPADLAGLRARTAAVVMLAGAAGGQASAGEWVTADGDLAGHPVHIFTPARETP
jgi:hypothetical protein